MTSNHLFQAQESKLEIYNGKPIINVGLEYNYYDPSCVDPEEETPFGFDGYISSYLRVYNERLGRLLKTIPLDRTNNILLINSTDTTFSVNGNYWYEVGYLQTGGYEFVMEYGTLSVK